MAKCKVLNRPDYELTLSSEERDGLMKLLKEVSTSQYDRMEITHAHRKSNNSIYHVLYDC
jgi:hypothetical protein